MTSAIKANRWLDHPLASGVPPAWASAWGDSRYGPWVAFSVRGIEYRMFWMPAGTFEMGSPDDEPGRDGDEGPRHQVTLTSGFWMGETPCTQALWTAVMGPDANPSEFVDPERPVHNVSWEDAQSFLQTLERQSGVSMRLPTEAQWEYACRAGTPEATYAGPIEIRGENNAPVLDAIAWYGGNSGVDFDLEDGWDSSDWGEKQYPHTKAGTRPVKTRRRNPWGLCDMLGNVWEWCHDGRRTYYHSHAYDPIGPVEGADRVLRGGCWDCPAQGVRAAYRGGGLPSDRDSFFGFRLSRGQGAPSKPASGGPEGR